MVEKKEGERVVFRMVSEGNEYQRGHARDKRLRELPETDTKTQAPKTPSACFLLIQLPNSQIIIQELSKLYLEGYTN